MFGKAGKCRAVFITIVILTAIYPSAAHAYVDPGITGMFFQAVFAFVFGILFVWFMKPYKYFLTVARRIKSVFLKKKNPG